MSAFVVSKQHMDAIINFARAKRVTIYFLERRYDFGDPSDALELGNVLVRENVRSVNYRYSDDDYAEDYTLTPLPFNQRSPVGILKALACYEYQSCEHPEYYESFAYRITQAIQQVAIEALPGYETEPWEINEYNKPAPPAPVSNVISDEPEIMTAVLGQKPDPTGWYRNALQQVAANLTTAPVMPKTKFMEGVINVLPVMSKARKHYPPTPYPNEKADICRGQWIRIYGISDSGVAFDRTFKIGDTAEYHSYNFSYTGKIVAIGEKTVKIDDGYGSKKTTQLDLHTFIWRNWDLDLEKIAERRLNWSD